MVKKDCIHCLLFALLWETLFVGARGKLEKQAQDSAARALVQVSQRLGGACEHPGSFQALVIGKNYSLRSQQTRCPSDQAGMKSLCDRGRSHIFFLSKIH